MVEQVTWENFSKISHDKTLDTFIGRPEFSHTFLHMKNIYNDNGKDTELITLGTKLQKKSIGVYC